VSEVPIRVPAVKASSITTSSSARATAPSPFYVPQLDGLRFVAFLMVFIHHAPAMAVPSADLSALANQAKTFGWMGVDLFFCLSSFLITTLLVREQEAKGRISLKSFYIRRALRIWPLYFLALFLVFIGFPLIAYDGPAWGTAEHFTLIRQHLFTTLTFLGNFSYASFPGSLTGALAPLWSISVEEQFYIVWPLLLSFLPRMRVKVFTLLLTGLLALTVGTRLYILVNAIPYPMVWVNTLARLDPFLMGTGLALLTYYKGRVVPVWAVVGASLVLFRFVVMFPQVGASLHTTWQLLAVAVACSLLLLGVLHSRLSVVLLGNGFCRWVGKLSYGFYVYHMVGMHMAFRYVRLSHAEGTWGYSLDVAKFMLFGLCCTMALGTVSYYGFERWFLLLKKRFTVIPSRAV
jgi:peptidoglycan/LPS O-acetylase OafA/YrhL